MDVLIHDIIKKYVDKQKIFKTENIIEVYDGVENSWYNTDYLVDKIYIISVISKIDIIYFTLII